MDLVVFLEQVDIQVSQVRWVLQVLVVGVDTLVRMVQLVYQASQVIQVHKELVVTVALKVFKDFQVLLVIQVLEFQDTVDIQVRMEPKVNQAIVDILALE